MLVNAQKSHFFKIKIFSLKSMTDEPHISNRAVSSSTVRECRKWCENDCSVCDNITNGHVILWKRYNRCENVNWLFSTCQIWQRWSLYFVKNVAGCLVPSGSVYFGCPIICCECLLRTCSWWFGSQCCFKRIYAVLVLSWVCRGNP